MRIFYYSKLRFVVDLHARGYFVILKNILVIQLLDFHAKTQLSCKTTFMSLLHTSNYRAESIDHLCTFYVSTSSVRSAPSLLLPFSNLLIQTYNLIASTINLCLQIRESRTSHAIFCMCKLHPLHGKTKTFAEEVRVEEMDL